MSVTFLPLLLLLLLAAVALGWVVLVYRTAGIARDTHDGPRCGACGYDVRGVASLACPECGADLRHAGILPPHLRMRSRGLSPLSKVVLWLLFVGVTGLVITNALAAAVLPRTQAMHMTHALTGPGSGAYQAVGITTAAQRTILPRNRIFGQRLAGEVELRVQLLDGSDRAVVIDAGNAGWAPLPARTPHTRVPFGADDMYELLAAAGVDVADPLVQAELPVVMTELDAAVQGAVVSSGSSSGSRTSGGGRIFQKIAADVATSSTPHAFARAGVALVWIAIAAVGVMRIVSRSRGAAV